MGAAPRTQGEVLLDRISAVMVLLTGLVAVAVLIFSFADVTEGEKHYGFYPLTHALLAGSPAIDAGNNAVCAATDQRGVARDAACDVGAYEFVP